MGLSSNKEEKVENYCITGVIIGSKTKRASSTTISYSVNNNQNGQNLSQSSQFNQQKKKSSNYQKENFNRSLNNPHINNKHQKFPNNKSENNQNNFYEKNSSNKNIINGGEEIPNKNLNNNNYNNLLKNEIKSIQPTNEFNFNPELKNNNYGNKYNSNIKPSSSNNRYNNKKSDNNNLNFNSEQNITKKNDIYDINNINKNNDENVSYPNLSELDCENNFNNVIQQDNNDDAFISKDDSFDIEIPKFQPIDVEAFSDVDKFIKEIRIQDDFNENEQEENGNKTYKQLKLYEKQKLKKIFLENKENFEKVNLNKTNLVINFDPNLVSNFIKNENSKSAFKNLIIKEIELIKSDEKKYKIDHLTILIVGKKKVGKKSLIKYMLKLNDSQINSKKGAKKEDFQAFQNPEIPHLRLVKYRGIGLGKENDAEKIKNQTINYINKQIKKGGYNDFVHCIWFCISGTRMQPKEEEYLFKLRKVYSNVDMPIIIIYLNEYTKVNSMEAEIKKQFDVDFINVISKVINKPNNSGKVNPKGEKELMNLTLDKCKEALQGFMPKVMMKNISNEILYKMINFVEIKKQKVKNGIREKFNNEFKNVLDDKKFIEYIINLLGRNLSIFYEKNISNKNLNLLINSEIISSIKIFMNKCKKFVGDLISNDIIYNAKDFIDMQASLEKKNKENINIGNKRTLKGFIKTNEIFFKKNFYYIAQKYIIYYFILFYCDDYFNEFQKQFNDIINNLINQDENSDINKFIADCFASKLKKFGEKMNINFGIEKYENNNLEISYNNNNIIDEKLLLENEGDNSFEMNFEEDEEPMINNNEENEKVIISYLTKIFKFNNDLKYINKDLSPILLNFLINFKFIDTTNNYFKKNNYFNNSILNSLKEYEKYNLELFLKHNVHQFLNIIDENFKKINKNCDLINDETNNMIKNIFKKECLEKIQLTKIQKEFEELSADIQYKKIGYVTIIITGKTGVGKSTLINALLKEYLAKESMKDICTKKPCKYENKKVSFLKLIDTRGIEIQPEFGISKISEEINKIVNDPKELDNYKSENFENPNIIEENKNLTYNDYVQCIWYCVTGTTIESEEIEFIENLKKQKNKVPIIIVYTLSEDANKMEKMKNEINKYINDISYIEVLSKDEEGLESFGLDELINITVEKCKYSYESKTFDEMRQEINQTLINNFKKKNNNIKYAIINEAISHFIENFDKNFLDNIQFKKYIYYLFAILFNGYLKMNEKSKVSDNLFQAIIVEFHNSNISNYLNKMIKCYNEISEKFIDKMKEEKAIHFLDKQALFEKIKSNLEIKDKCNKSDFINMIESFLKNNFSYLAQKYFIYKFLLNIIERFSELIENEVNENLFNILSNNSQIYGLFKNIYSKKFEDLNEIIQEFLKNESYHKPKNDNKKSYVIKKEKEGFEVNVDEIDSLNLGEDEPNLFN